MEDHAIIDLYWQRQEAAISETAQKYGSFLTALSRNILRSVDDAEECVNDTYLRAWNSIPPQRPSAFKVWLGRITRNLSLDRWRRINAAKRSGDETDILLGELDSCVPATKDVERHLEDQEIADIISAFLHRQTVRNRTIFLRRYWYGASIAEIAEGMHCTESAVKLSLFRTRAKLRETLEKEGIVL
ncbi:MAG: RNA polymerase sigma factor [Oscillibacter sp.]|nr:RNA polymerase sigma factor [Oscillibacter sp.]